MWFSKTTISVLTIVAGLILAISSVQAQATRYADGDGDQANGGTSWADTSANLQTALSLASSPGCVPGELLVVYRKGVTENQKQIIQSEHSMTLLSASPSRIHRYRWEPYRESAATSQQRYLALLQQAERVQAEPGIRFAEPNYKRYINRVPNDPLYENNQEWHYEAINLPAAWDTTIGDEQIIVALVDTGVLLDHPDLQGRLVPGYDFISDLDTANDGDGIDDDPSDPGDSLSGNSSFHGTHVAGTIGAATDNAFGVAGVTWNCRIMPIRALGVGGGTIADIVEGMLFAGGLPNASGTVPAEPAQVLNLSLGGYAGEAESAIERAAIQDLVAAGVTVVAAAGNEGSSLPAPPAFYPETISVGAVQATLDLASYSNFGNTIDVVAPGGDISADDNGDGVPDGVFSTIGDDSGGTIVNTFGFFEGTSMACPHVSGVIALMLSVDPELTPAQVRAVLTTTAVDLGDPGKDDIFGFGLIDAEAAVLAQCFEDADCTDHDVCNGEETCNLATNECVAGDPLDCRDDGLYCNGDESCDPVDSCVHSGDPCAAGTVCNEDTDTCDPIGCTSDNDCTDPDLPYCDLQTGDCVACLEHNHCDNNDVCDGEESCVDNVCTPGSPLQCGDGDVCNGQETCHPTDGCQDGTPLACDDNDVCDGIETCDSVFGCLAGDPLDCPDDGLFCNGDESCDPVGGCVHSGGPCAAGTVCNEGTDTCDPIGCTSDDDCTDPDLPYCHVSSSECVECLADSHCDNGDYCDGEETCVDNVCVTGSDPCTDPNLLLCDEVNDECVKACNFNADCNDKDVCTEDSCVASVCVNVPKLGIPGCCLSAHDCQDGVDCNGVEMCDIGSGTCQAGASACPADKVCDEANDVCVDCLTRADCDDGDFCNGEESCVNKICVAGSDPCTDPNFPVCDEGAEECVAQADNENENENENGNENGRPEVPLSVAISIPADIAPDGLVDVTVTGENLGSQNLAEVILFIEFGPFLEVVNATPVGSLNLADSTFEWQGEPVNGGGTLDKTMIVQLASNISQSTFNTLLETGITLTAIVRHGGVDVDTATFNLRVVEGGTPPEPSPEPQPESEEEVVCGCGQNSPPMAAIVLLGLAFMRYRFRSWRQR